MREAEATTTTYRQNIEYNDKNNNNDDDDDDDDDTELYCPQNELFLEKKGSIKKMVVLISTKQK